MTYPQPREGITGTDLGEEHFLSLEESALAARRIIVVLAGTLRTAVLVGNPAPVVARMWERMKAPVPGDLVVEMSAMRRGAEDWHTGCGILLAHRREWWTTDDEWAATIAEERADHEAFLRGPYAHPGDAEQPWEPDERITDHAWYVQYGPAAADVCRWVNCDFMMIPADPAFADGKLYGTRDGSSVTITRDDLLGTLADSGFALRLPAS